MVAKSVSFKAALFTWQKIIQFLLCCEEINKRGILNLVYWLGPQRAETGIPVTDMFTSVK